MPQLSLYIDGKTMDELRKAADEQGISLSRYARTVIQERERSAWPEAFWRTYGALSDDSFAIPEELDAALDGALPSFG